MVSGRRGISKCTAAVTSNLRLSSQEPLLFLYPAWARGITSQAAPIITNDAYPLIDEAACNHAPATPPSDESIPTRRPDRPSNPTATKAAAATNDDDLPVDRVQLAYERYKAKKLHGSETKAHISSREKASLMHHGHEPLPRRVVTGIKINRFISSHKPLARRVVTPIKINRILSNCKQLAQKEDVEQNTRDDYFRRMRMERELQVANEVSEVRPKDILDDLLKHTIPSTAGSAIQILVPPDALWELLFGTDNNIREIKHRTGADVDLIEEEEGGRGMRTLSITGSSVCVSTAAAIILSALPGSILKFQPNSSTPPKSSTTKSKESNVCVKFRYHATLRGPGWTHKPVRADAVPTPEVWTPESLHKYVVSLTRMPMPSHMHRLLYEPGEEHQWAVAELLDKVFDADECLDIMSLRTLNEGIKYFTKKNQMHFVRDIYFKVRLRGMKLDTETFNIMLRNAAKVEDFDTFSHLLKSMVENQYRPNSGTWLAFLSMLKTPKFMKVVVGHMEKFGLFHEGGVQKKAHAILSPYVLQAALNRDPRTTILDFARTMEKNFSGQWLTLSGANKLLHILGSRGLISECWLLIDYMVERGIKPTDISCNTILEAACKHSGFEVGIDILRPLMDDYGFKPDGVTWAILSKQVWDAEYSATARVIWRYGCLKGWISYPMRHRVANSLKKMLLNAQSTKSAPDSERQLWAQNGGAFVIMDQSAQAAARSTIATSSPKEESALERVAFEAVKNDTDLFMRYKPVDDPVAVIKRALAVDLEAAGRSYESFPEKLKWLNEHAPVVSKTKRDLPASAYSKRVLQTPSSNAPSIHPGASPKAIDVTLRVWRWRQQRSEEQRQRSSHPGPHAEASRDESEERCKEDDH